MSTWTNRASNPPTSWNSNPTLDAEATQTGIILNEAGTSGTYTSAAQAAQSFIGSKYKLNDNRNFIFGMDDDIKMRWDAGVDALVVEVNGEVDLFSLSSTGMNVRSITFAEQDALPLAEDGKVVYYNNNLYIGKGE